MTEDAANSPISSFRVDYERRLSTSRRLYESQGFRGFPWGLVEDLSLGDACYVVPLLCELGVGVGTSPLGAEVTVAVRTAARCSRVVDLASDPRFGGDRDWGPFEQAVTRFSKRGLRSEALALSALLATVAEAWRSQLSEGDDSPGGSYIERLRDEERDTTRAVKKVVDSIDALDTVLSQSGQWFHPSATAYWWQLHHAELQALVAELADQLNADIENFGEHGTIVESLMRVRGHWVPSSGNRKGHLPLVYSAYELALRLVRERLPIRGSVPETKRIFEALNIRLTDNAINLARQRRRRVRALGRASPIGEIG